MSSRRGWREDGVFFEHNSPCRDSDRHRHCDGRWRGVISLGYDADGRRIRRKGQAERPSKSLSLEQASALLAAVEGTRMHAYIALCLATGIRTEEARALRWEHVDFGDPVANPPAPASAAVWRSVRSHEDTKTEKSRRTLALPEMAVNALWAHKQRQAGERAAAGLTWSERDLVFSGLRT